MTATDTIETTAERTGHTAPFTAADRARMIDELERFLTTSLEDFRTGWRTLGHRAEPATARV